MSNVISFCRATNKARPMINQARFVEARGYDPLIRMPHGLFAASDATPPMFDRLIDICRTLANHFKDEIWSDAVVWVDIDYSPLRDRVCVLNEMLDMEPFHAFLLLQGERQLTVECCEYENRGLIPQPKSPQA